MVKYQDARVGLISRIDYGSKGFRRAVVREGFDTFKREAVSFIILLGGLVSKKAIAIQMKEYVSENLASLKAKSVERAAIKIELEANFLKKIAEELSELIPVVNKSSDATSKKEISADIFIVTSPAYDGDVGASIARLLSELRSDIKFYPEGGDRFRVKYLKQLTWLWALTPVRSSWRGDYYSTATERVIKDKIKQTSQPSPNIYVVGGHGTAIQKPKGELKYQYVSVPACHRLEETSVSENQIGVGILEFPAEGGRYIYRVWSFKDLVSRELSYIVPPEKANKIQRGIIEIIKEQGSATRGIVEDDLNISSKQAEEEIKKLLDTRRFGRRGENWPGIHVTSGQKLYFNLEFLQNRLKYPTLLSGKEKEDRVLSFGCMHAGSTETDYRFLIEKVADIILRHDVTMLVDAGDTIEGTEHDLLIKGEVIGGLNNTKMEKLAANIIGVVILKVFKKRFDDFLKVSGDKPVIQDKVIEAIKSSLIVFNYILGNHDLWQTKHGHEPLELFRVRLARSISKYIQSYLADKKMPAVLIDGVVEGNIMNTEILKLPSGLQLSVQHPHMSRAKTTSIRPQEMMEYGKRLGCQVTIGANFHVAETVAEWDQDLGQCVCQEVGTVKHGSNFERHKMKTVDQGVGLLRIVSKDNRILMTESMYEGEIARDEYPHDSTILNYLNEAFKEFGMEPVK